jgi:hypothetical protein
MFIGCQQEQADPGDPFAATNQSLQLPPAGPHSCDGDKFPISVSATTRECCQLGNETWHISPSNGGVAHREYRTPCSGLDGGTSCTSDCAFGPCGAHTINVFGSAPSYIFKPVSNPNVCGYQADGPTGSFNPEPYDGQELWPDIASTCPFTKCLAGGMPAVTLIVTAIGSGATGQVESKPAGIALVGNGSQSGDFTDTDVKLKAIPLGPHARAVLTGGCTETGDYGEAAPCKLELGPNKQVTVTYECEPGFTCSL